MMDWTGGIKMGGMVPGTGTGFLGGNMVFFLFLILILLFGGIN